MCENALTQLAHMWVVKLFSLPNHALMCVGKLSFSLSNLVRMCVGMLSFILFLCVWVMFSFLHLV